MTSGTFLSPLKNIFKIKISTDYYNYHNRADFPYGTMSVNIRCGIINLSFSLKPSEIQSFLSNIIVGREQTVYGDAVVNTHPDYVKIQKTWDAIYEEEAWFTEQLSKYKPINDAINKYHNVKGEDLQTKLSELIKELEEHKAKLITNNG